MDSLNYDYQTDPLYQSSQGTLSPFYTSMLKGDINSYYSPIGEIGGGQFENMLNMAVRDTTRGVNEGMASKGLARSGLSAAALAPVIANTSGTLRYNDFLRALEGRKGFLNTATSGLEGVRSSALSNQQDINRIGYDVAKTNFSAEQEREAQEQAMWTSILSSGIGAVGNIAGMGMLGNIMKPMGSASAGVNAAAKSNQDYFTNMGRMFL